MRTCDVLIVGGGPAGSSCAWALGNQGLDVVVLDQASFPRDKVCAGWITPAVLDVLKLDPAKYGGDRVFQPMTNFRVGRIGGRATGVDYGRAVSYGIRRCEFDHFLLQRSGASLRLGTKVRDVQRTGRTWRVDDAFSAPILVAAGGHFCPVARRLGSSSDRRSPVVIAQEVEFRLASQQNSGCPIPPGAAEIYFCCDLAGYGWCVRKGDWLNIGLGREARDRFGEHLTHFTGWLEQRGRIPPDTSLSWRGHAYFLYGHSPRKLLDDGLLVIGDAAGLAFRESGEGIRPAIESGLLAADTILAAQGNYDQGNLQPYATAITERFGPRDGNGAAFPWIPAFFRHTVAAGLLATPYFVRHTVLDRWFFRVQQSALARHDGMSRAGGS
jgi:flavin-dependent dehydrogenase